MINEVLSEVKPVLYTLKDLMSDKIPGFYYHAQLTKAPEPKDSDYRLVEKILDTKVIDGVKYQHIKFLFYPEKFNLWLPESHIQKGH